MSAIFPALSLGALLRRLREERELAVQAARDLGIFSVGPMLGRALTLPPRPQIERIAGVLGIGVSSWTV